MAIIIERSQIQLETISNLISSGLLLQGEAERYNELLSAMPLNELLANLLESDQLRETCPNPINYYPIGEICPN